MSEFRTAYGPKLQVVLMFDGKGRTKQSFKEECDINNIMARFQKTGVFDFTTKYQPQYGDVTAMQFQAAMDVVAQANTMFHDMPARVRDRFQNKPEKFLEFVQNPENRAEAMDLGLLKKAQVASAPAGAAGAASISIGAPGAPVEAAKPA